MYIFIIIAYTVIENKIKPYHIRKLKTLNKITL